MCGHKTEKVVLPGQCVGSKKNRVFLGFLEVTLRFEENLQLEPLCIQPAATNLDSTTSSGTSFACKRNQASDEHKCETVLLSVLCQSDSSRLESI